MLNLKKCIFGLFIIMLIVSCFYSFGKFLNGEETWLYKQSYALMSGIKFLTAIALYIAWRVTPNSKQ